MVIRSLSASARLVLALSAAIGVLAGGNARAADAMAAQSAQSAFADTSKPVTFLEATVVTGARYPRRFFESPQALSYLSRAQLSEMAPAVIGDVFQQLPGVDNSKDSPWEQRPVLRGLSGQRVLVLMDGMPMNSARGNGPHPSLVDAAQVERIEMVRGPSSVAYGSDAIAGAINIITRQPLPASSFSTPRGMTGAASAGASSADKQFGGQAELRPHAGKLSALVSGGWHDARDFTSPNGEVHNSAYSDWNGLVGANYELSPLVHLTSGYQLYRANDIGIPGLSFALPGASQDFAFRYYDRDIAHLTLEQRSRSTWLENTMVRAYYQRERRNFFSSQNLDASQYSNFGVPSSSGSTFAITNQDRFFDLSTIGAQAQLTSRRQKYYLWTAGLDFASDRTGGDNERRRTYHYDDIYLQDSSGTTQSTVTQPVPEGQFANYGSYLQSDWYLMPQLTLNAGGRYTHHHYHADAGQSSPGFSFAERNDDTDHFSGSLGLVYEPLEDLYVSANVANGYRQPNAQDLYFDGAASVGFVIGNPALESERSLTYDLGLRYGYGPLALSGNLFKSYYHELIDAVAMPSVPEAQGQPTYQYTNISEATIWGGEAEGELSFVRDWRVRSTLSGAMGDITSPTAIQQLYGVTTQDKAILPGVPPLRGTAAVRWTEPQSRGWIEAGTRWSWRTNRLPLPTPGVSQFSAFKKEWVVADLTMGLRTPQGQRLVAGVRNVTDRLYRQALGSLDEPGRSFFASLSTDF